MLSITFRNIFPQAKKTKEQNRHYKKFSSGDFHSPSHDPHHPKD
jgi:hypothetical protein